MIEPGLLYGFGAALGFGASDVTATIASRRAGAVFAAVGIQATMAVLYSIMLLLTGERLPDDPRLFGQVAVVGTLVGIAYVITYQAFRLGPVTVTGPVVSTLGGMTVILAVVFLGERPSPVQGLGVVAATVGMVLLGVSVDGGLRRARLAGPGVIFALAAIVLWAGATVGITAPIREAGWLPAIATSRIVGGIVLCWLVVVAVGLRRVRDGRRGGQGGAPDLPGGWRARAGLDRRAVALVVVMGLCDTLGFSVMSMGLEGSDAWLVGIVSSFGPSVTVLFGLAVLRERLRPPQWLGLGLVFGSIVLIGMR